jgi:hypothetical protein
VLAPQSSPHLAARQREPELSPIPAEAVQKFLSPLALADKTKSDPKAHTNRAIEKTHSSSYYAVP